MTYPGTLLLGAAVGIAATVVALAVVALTGWGLWTLAHRSGWIHTSTYTITPPRGPAPPHHQEQL